MSKKQKRPDYLFGYKDDDPNAPALAHRKVVGGIGLVLGGMLAASASLFVGGLVVLASASLLSDEVDSKEKDNE